MHTIYTYFIFILAIILFLFGVYLLFGDKYKMLKQNSTENTRYTVAGSLIFLGSVSGFTLYLSLFTDEPYWLLHKVFGFISGY